MRFRKVFLLLALPLLLFAKSSKSYYYPEVRTEVHILADGNVNIIQERTYAFKGSFSYAYVDLKKQGAQDITLNRLAEKAGANWRAIQPDITNGPKSLYLRWNYSAQDETKTFLLDYTIRGAVKRWQDVAEFYWKVIEEEHERIAHASTEVILPQSSPDLFKVYIHSAGAPGTLTFNDALTQASVQQSGVPQNSFVEVRVLMQPSLFPSVMQQPQSHYENILNQEKQNFLVSSLLKYLLIPLSGILIVILPLVFLLVFYFRYGREPKLSYDATYEHEPPRNAPPLAVPAILHQKPEKSTMYQSVFNGMFATLLDLARKRIVSVQEIKEGHKQRYQFKLDKPEEVAKQDQFSRETVDFFFGEVAQGADLLTDEALKSYTKAHPTGVQSFLGGLLDESMEWWRKALGTDFVSSVSTRARFKFLAVALLSIVVGALLAGTGLSAIIGPGPTRWFIAGGAGSALLVVNFLGSYSILRWNEIAYLEHKRWKAFRKFLRDFSAIKQAPVVLLGIWEQYYVYATVLGVAKEFLKNVTRLAREQGTSLALPVWYIAASSGHGAADMAGMANGLAGFESFAANFSGMMDSFSASTSTGGGFSGGGGGGGGGGSSGAG